jgi:hypothetical protein
MDMGCVKENPLRCPELERRIWRCSGNRER